MTSVESPRVITLRQEVNKLLPRDTMAVAFNTLAAALLLVGGIIGFSTKGSKASLLVSALFAVSWLYTAYVVTKNSGKQLEITARRLMNKKLKETNGKVTDESTLFLRRLVNLEQLRDKIFKAYVASAVSSAALVVMMLIRVIVLEVELSTPILVVVATGTIVFVLNTQKAMFMKFM